MSENTSPLPEVKATKEQISAAQAALAGVQTANAQLQKALGVSPDLRFISVEIDAANDAVRRAAVYLQHKAAQAV